MLRNRGVAVVKTGASSFVDDKQTGQAGRARARGGVACLPFP